MNVWAAFFFGPDLKSWPREESSGGDNNTFVCSIFSSTSFKAGPRIRIWQRTMHNQPYPTLKTNPVEASHTCCESASQKKNMTKEIFGRLVQT